MRFRGYGIYACLGRALSSFYCDLSAKFSKIQLKITVKEGIETIH